MIIQLACNFLHVKYHEDQCCVLLCFFFTSITLCNVSNLLKFVLFVDDKNIFCSITSLHYIQDTVTRELVKHCVRFSVNRL